ncbi:MAG: TolC family protein [Fimbriimonadales bacterium]
MKARQLLPLALFAIASFAPAQEAQFKQLSLFEAVSFAMKNSPTLRAAQAEIDAARAETGVARSRTRPQLSINGFASQGSMPNILQSAMGVEPQALILAPEKGFLDGNLMLMAPLYTGGWLSGLVAAASAREQAAIAEASGMRAEVALKVREAYTRALYGVELVKAQQARVTAAEAMVRNAQALFEAGKGIEASVRRAEAELADAKRELTMAENERRKTLLDLLAEMGAALDSPVTLTETLEYKPVEGTLEAYLGIAMQTRGELIAARQRARAGQGQVSSAEGALRPQVYGFAMGDAFAPRDLMGKNSGYTVGLTVSLPVFDGGMRRSEVAGARAMRERALADVARLELQTAKEVRQAWLDIETAAENYRSAQAGLVAAQAAYEVMVVRVESGKGILVEQLDALAALTRARANLAQATYDHQLAIAKLYRAVGQVDARATGGISQ